MNQQIKAGLQDALPFGIGFVFLYLSIGMLGATKALTLWQTLSTSLFIFSTPLQFLLVQSGTNGYMLIPIILSLNSRFLLMSATLVPFFKEVKLTKFICSVILIVPSVLSACLLRFKQAKEQAFIYFVTIGSIIYVISVVCTFLGFILERKLHSPLLFKMMDLILPLQFTALAAKHWPNISYVSSYWLGFLIAPVLVYIFHSSNLLITPFLIGFVIVLFENIKKDK